MNSVVASVVKWAEDKALFEDNSPDVMAAQADKLKEEVGEFYDELVKLGDYEKAKMELGDVIVVCTVLARKLDTTPEACLKLAYDKISKRTGRTINGVFVKEE